MLNRHLKTWRYKLLRALIHAARRVRGRSAGRDEALAVRLQEAFERRLSATDVTGVQFYVLDGSVTVYGTVRHELDRDLVVGVIRSVNGVKGVVVHLQAMER